MSFSLMRKAPFWPLLNTSILVVSPEEEYLKNAISLHHKIQNKWSSSGKSSLGKDSAKKTSDHDLSIIQNKLGFVLLGSNIF